MLRTTFIVFLAGWTGWFLLDKPDQQQFGIPPAADSLLQNFQTAFDMAHAGFWSYAYLFIWHAHYLVLSLLTGILLAIVFGSVSDYFGRRRMRRLLFPARRGSTSSGQGGEPGPESTPVDNHKASG